VFDADGRLVAVSHHFGKNPYAGLDPLGLSPNMPLGELVLNGIRCALMASLSSRGLHAQTLNFCMHGGFRKVVIIPVTTDCLLLSSQVSGKACYRYLFFAHTPVPDCPSAELSAAGLARRGTGLTPSEGAGTAAA